jgi:hypothetical protein
VCVIKFSRRATDFSLNLITNSLINNHSLHSLATSSARDWHYHLSQSPPIAPGSGSREADGQSQLAPTPPPQRQQRSSLPRPEHSLARQIGISSQESNPILQTVDSARRDLQLSIGCPQLQVARASNLIANQSEQSKYWTLNDLSSRAIIELAKQKTLDQPT